MLDSILQLRSGKSKVLQGTDDGAIERCIRSRRTISRGQLGLRVDGSRRWFAIKHSSALEKLMGVLPLMKEEACRTTRHLDAEEVVERTQVLKGELGTKAVSELSKKVGGACCQDDVVDIEQQVSSGVALAIDEQRSIGACGAEAKLMKERCDALVPGARRLLEPVQGAREQAHMIRVGAVDEPRRLLAEHLLLEMTVEKGVRDVHLVHRPPARHRELEDGANRPWFDNRGEGVGEVDAGALTKAANHPAGLMTVKCAVRMELVLEDPLAGDDIGVARARNKLPRLVALQGIELLPHGREPQWVANSRPS